MPPDALFVAKPYSTAALIDAVHAVLDARAGLILVPEASAALTERPVTQDKTPALPSARPMIPAGIPLDPLQAAIGSVGGLAQPLSEPDE
jgi:hypothetical protein